MIDHWLDKKGLRANDKSGGWPEWEATQLDRPYRHRLQYDSTERFRVSFNCLKEWRYSHHVGHHEALCILRDHKRVWLWDNHQIVVVREYEAPHEWEALQVGATDEIGDCIPNDACADYDEAMIDAILAMEGAKP